MTKVSTIKKGVPITIELKGTFGRKVVIITQKDYKMKEAIIEALEEMFTEIIWKKS